MDTGGGMEGWMGGSVEAAWGWIQVEGWRDGWEEVDAEPGRMGW